MHFISPFFSFIHENLATLLKVVEFSVSRFIRFPSNAFCCNTFVNDYGDDDDFIYEIFSVSRGTINEIEKYREISDSTFDSIRSSIFTHMASERALKDPKQSSKQ